MLCSPGKNRVMAVVVVMDAALSIEILVPMNARLGSIRVMDRCGSCQWRPESWNWKTYNRDGISPSKRSIFLVSVFIVLW